MAFRFTHGKNLISAILLSPHEERFDSNAGSLGWTGSASGNRPSSADPLPSHNWASQLTPGTMHDMTDLPGSNHSAHEVGDEYQEAIDVGCRRPTVTSL